jgi:hypothetical protein
MPVKITLRVEITLRLEITLERVVIVLVSVIITLIRVKTTLVYMEIILCVWNHAEWKSHSACRNRTVRVEIALCVLKSHSYVLKSHSCHSKSHCVWKNMCKNNTRSCWNSTFRSEITLVRVTITLCMWTSPYACEHHTMRLNITLCVWALCFLIFCFLGVGGNYPLHPPMDPFLLNVDLFSYKWHFYWFQIC